MGTPQDLEPINDPLIAPQSATAETNSIWGTTIPWSFGYRGIEGKVIWASDSRIIKQNIPSSIFSPPPPPLPPISFSIIPIGGGWPNGGPIMSFDGVPGGGNPFTAYDEQMAQYNAERANDPAPVEAQEIVTAENIDFAVSLGYQLEPENERGNLKLLKIYAEDNILIYDASNGGGSKLPGLTITYHPGRPDALPDATIQNALGTDTPSFRNLIYIVFKDFPLMSLGLKNKLPKITAVIWNDQSQEGLVEPFDTLDTDINDMIVGDGVGIDWKTRRMYGFSNIIDGPMLHCFDLDTKTELYKVPIEIKPGEGNPDLVWFVLYDFEDNVVFYMVGHGGNSKPIYGTDIQTGELKYHFGLENNGGTYQDLSAASSFEASLIKTDDWTGLLLHSSTFGKTGVYTVTRKGDNDLAFGTQLDYGLFLTVMLQSGTIPLFEWLGDIRLYGLSDDLHGVCAYNVPGGGNGWHAYVGTGGSINLISGYWGLAPSDTVPALHIRSVTRVQRFAGANVLHMFVDQNDGNLIVLLENKAHSKNYIAKAAIRLGSTQQHDGFFPEFAGFMYFNEIPAFGSGRLNQGLQNCYNTEAGVWGYPSDGGVFTTINLGNGTVETQRDVPAGYIGTSIMYGYDAMKDIVYSGKHSGLVQVWPVEVKFGRPVEPNIPLSDVVRWLSLKAGYVNDEIQVTGMNDLVLGGIIDDPTSVWQTCSQLSKVYNFQYYQSDGKIKFVGASANEEQVPVYTIRPSEMVLTGGGDEKAALLTTLGAPDEIASDVQISYRDVELKFADNSQTFRRPQFPFKTAASGKVQTYQIPIVATNGEMYQRAALLAYNQYQANQSQGFRISRKYSRVEPSDIIRVPVNGYEYNVRVTETTFNGDDSINISGLEANYRSDVVMPTEEPLGRDAEVVQGPSDSLPLLVETNLLAPLDENVGKLPSIYTGVGSLGQVYWQEATIQEKEKGGNWTILRKTDNDVPYGYATVKLPNVTHAARTHDEFDLDVSCITIQPADLIQSVSSWWHIAGVNAILVGQPGRWECIYYREVELLSSKVVRFKGLLRGRRGTETHVGDHKTGDMVLMVRWASLAPSSGNDGRVPQPARADLRNTIVADPTTTVGDSVAVRAIGTGVIGKPPLKSAVLEGCSLKPWAPARVKAERQGNGDIIFTWERRTRVDGPWSNGDGTNPPTPTPLNEDEEKYQFTILNPLDLEGLPLINAEVVDPTYTLVASDTDDAGIDAFDRIRVQVLQKSAQVGNGYVADKLVSISNA